MSSSYALYRKFENEDSLLEIIDILREKEIPFKVENVTAHFNPSMLFPISQEFDLKIKTEDFERVNELLINSVQESVAELPNDYYLYAFSDKELMEILYNQEQWGNYDIALARKILTDKKVTIDEASIESNKKQRLELLARPEDLALGWIIAGFVFALLGGVFAIIFGSYLMSSKKTLPDGNKVYRYSRFNQKLGFAMMLLGIIIVIVAVVLKLLNPYRFEFIYQLYY